MNYRRYYKRCTLTVGDPRGYDTAGPIKKPRPKPKPPKDKEWEKLFDI